MKANITKLVFDHSTPNYHKGRECENIIIAYKLIITKNTPNKIETYDQYINLCESYGVEPYNEDVFNDYINNVYYEY